MADGATEALRAAVVEDRRYLHAHPELSFEERETVRYLASRIEAMGLSPEPVAGGLVVRLAGGGGAGRTVALRADMDALPVDEAADVPFRSQTPGVMHACGHDAHMAIALGVMGALARRRATLRGEVRFVFQPGEESPPGGALAMIEAGALRAVDAVIGVHLASELEAGRGDVRPGVVTANSDRFEIAVAGRGGHASRPHLCVDSALCAAQILVALQTIVSRRLDPLEPAVVTVGEIHAGSAPNVIPQTARLSGTVRTFSAHARHVARAEIERISAAVAEGAGATAEVRYVEGYPACANPEGEPTAALQAAVREVLGEGGLVAGRPRLAGDDFAYYGRTAPATFLFLGSGGPDGAPHHSPLFRVDEACLTYGVEIVTRAIERLVAVDV